MPVGQNFVGLLAATVADITIARIAIPQYFSNRSFTVSASFFFIVNLAILLVWKLIVYPNYLHPLRNLPGPQTGGRPFLGHELVAFERPPGRTYYSWMTKIQNEGLLQFKTLGDRHLLLTDPKALGEVLVTNSYDYQKPQAARDMLRTTLGEGLVVAEGDVHRFQRKNVQPTFNFKVIKGLYPMMMAKAIKLTHILEASTTKDEKGWMSIEMDQWSNRATLDIIGVAGLGREFNTLRDDKDPLVAIYRLLSTPTAASLRWFAASLIFGRRLVRALPADFHRVMDETTADLRRICVDMVRDKKAAVESGRDQHIDVLSELIRTNNFSDDALVDQLLTFLAAGHETTSSTFSWVLYELSRRTEIQTALRQEIRKSLPSLQEPLPSDFDLAATLESMPLLNGVCQEILRLYPTVSFTRRVAQRETRILDQAVPKGTTIDISIWALNRLPALWGPTADAFDPRRWIETTEDGGERPNKNGGAESNYALMTFLHGPRSCIGQGFAKAELRVLVASFISVFEVELTDKNKAVEEFGLVTIKPKDGLPVKIRRAQ